VYYAPFFYAYSLGLIGQEIDGEYTSYHFDYRGSTVALTDSSGQIVEQYQYSPYGLLLSGDSSKTPFLFNGKYGVMTDANNLYYMRARFYSPEIKRFINQDILLGDVFEGQTLNRYAFVTGRPISFVDPFGLDGMPIGMFPLDWRALFYFPIIKDAGPNEVYLCKRTIAISWLPNGLTYVIPRHHWLLTEKYESGMGADCPIPGQGCSDIPYTPTQTKEHNGQSQQSNAYCQLIEDVNVECVNRLIEPGNPTGLWTIFNQCQTFADSVLTECSTVEPSRVCNTFYRCPPYLTDSSGQITESFQYSPYGLLLSGDSSKTPFLFNGKYGVMTDSNNLYYMRARFYSPEIKRFVNQDILLGGIGKGQTLNRYAFVTGKPVSLIDPFGFGGHTPGGPYHRDEVKKKCTKDDTCPQLKAKMWIFQRMINSHQGWDNHLPPPRGGDRHKDEIGKLWRGWTRCQSLYYSKGCGGAPLFNPVPNPSENVKKNTVCFTGIAAYLIWNLKGCVFGPAGCAVDLMTPGF